MFAACPDDFMEREKILGTRVHYSHYFLQGYSPVDSIFRLSASHECPVRDMWGFRTRDCSDVGLKERLRNNGNWGNEFRTIVSN
jgi:hypothetical protein